MAAAKKTAVRKSAVKRPAAKRSAAKRPAGGFYLDTTTREKVDETIQEYLGFFRGKNEKSAAARRSGYATMINDFYDVVTDFYEYGWGRSFHFAPRFAGESFRESILRAEYFLASRLGLKPGMRVLDVGCGIGEPARNIARFSGARIEGVNNNDYQLAKMERFNRAAGLEELCTGFKGDFMALDVQDQVYDAAYEIEATCHAPDKVKAFQEIHRVLKPGAVFAGYEWCLTDAFDSTDERHLELKHEIETGNSLPDIATVPELTNSLQKAGFEIVEILDVANSGDPETPWYGALEGDRLSLTSVRRSAAGRYVGNRALAVLELLGVAPRGATEVSDTLNDAADALVAAGRLGIFTPDLFFLVRRPV
ncbi:MAG: methyltransferase domain-containing protein [Myxococcota bacterium]|nr:methyltransferase domain-containing protein [Myxococcota bacterium]